MPLEPVNGRLWQLGQSGIRCKPGGVERDSSLLTGRGSTFWLVASNRSALGTQPSAASNSDAAYVEFEEALADVLAEHEQKYSIARRRALWSTTAF